MAYRVLLVDDDPDLLTLLELTLKIAGYDVARAESGEQAKGLLAEFKPHVMILDIMMPGISGFDVLRELRSHTPSPPEVVVLSARTGINDVIESQELGAFTYLFKPVTRSKLLESIEAALAARSRREQPTE